MSQSAPSQPMDHPDAGDSGLSDKERESAAERLRLHFRDGRLSSEELLGRIELVYEAKSRTELDRVMGDLPLATSQPQPVTTAPQGNCGRYASGARYLVGIATPSIVCTGAWILSGHHGQFWPGWVMLGSGALALKHFSRGGVSRRTRRRRRYY
jgi:hypothetical protein